MKVKVVWYSKFKYKHPRKKDTFSWKPIFVTVEQKEIKIK